LFVLLIIYLLITSCCVSCAYKVISSIAFGFPEPRKVNPIASPAAVKGKKKKEINKHERQKKKEH
jgi:hypothetical protein